MMRCFGGGQSIKPSRRRRRRPRLTKTSPPSVLLAASSRPTSRTAAMAITQCTAGRESRRSGLPPTETAVSALRSTEAVTMPRQMAGIGTASSTHPPARSSRYTPATAGVTWSVPSGSRPARWRETRARHHALTAAGRGCSASNSRCRSLARAVTMTETLWKRRGDIAPPKPTRTSRQKKARPFSSNQMKANCHQSSRCIGRKLYAAVMSAQ